MAASLGPIIQCVNCLGADVIISQYSSGGSSGESRRPIFSSGCYLISRSPLNVTQYRGQSGFVLYFRKFYIDKIDRMHAINTENGGRLYLCCMSFLVLNVCERTKWWLTFDYRATLVANSFNTKLSPCPGLLAGRAARAPAGRIMP